MADNETWICSRVGAAGSTSSRPSSASAVWSTISRTQEDVSGALARLAAANQRAFCSLESFSSNRLVAPRGAIRTLYGPRGGRSTWASFETTIVRAMKRDQYLFGDAVAGNDHPHAPSVRFRSRGS